MRVEQQLEHELCFLYRKPALSVIIIVEQQMEQGLWIENHDPLVVMRVDHGWSMVSVNFFGNHANLSRHKDGPSKTHFLLVTFCDINIVNRVRECL